MDICLYQEVTEIDIYLSQPWELSISEKTVLHVTIKVIKLKSYLLIFNWPSGYDILLETNLGLCLNSIWIWILLDQ